MHSDFYNISITHHTLPSFLTVRPHHFPAQGPPLLLPPTSHWWHKQGFTQHRPRPSGSPLVQLHVCARLDFPRVLEPPPRAQCAGCRLGGSRNQPDLGRMCRVGGHCLH